MKVIKRDGIEQDFNTNKIFNVVKKACSSVGHSDYIVGGFIRDSLLKSGNGYMHQPNDVDYMVVDATVEEMHKRFPKTVGVDFPVWLDEQGNEWALARVERSTGDKYSDFEFTTEGVTLEDDLKRRDLTINAMAIRVEDRFSFICGASDGYNAVSDVLIDPYGGLRDLESKTLRHVSEAFSEDPLRILRLARFKARYHQDGFTVAPETVELCRQMVRAGMLNKVSSDRIWKETEKALEYSDFVEYFKFLSLVGWIPTLDFWDRYNATKRGKLHRGFDYPHYKELRLAALGNVGLADFVNAPKDYMDICKRTWALNDLITEREYYPQSDDIYQLCVQIGVWKPTTLNRLEVALDACQSDLLASLVRIVWAKTSSLKPDVPQGPAYGAQLVKMRIQMIEEIMQ